MIWIIQYVTNHLNKCYHMPFHLINNINTSAYKVQNRVEGKESWRLDIGDFKYLDL